MGFSKQEYWSGLPFLPPGNLLDPGKESPALAGQFFVDAKWCCRKAIVTFTFILSSIGSELRKEQQWTKEIKALCFLLQFLCYLNHCGSDGKESAYNAGDLGSVPGQEDPLEKGMATHSSILAWRNSMDRGAWKDTVHGVADSWTWLSV